MPRIFSFVKNKKSKSCGQGVSFQTSSEFLSPMGLIATNSSNIDELLTRGHNQLFPVVYSTTTKVQPNQCITLSRKKGGRDVSIPLFTILD